jgi:hypothetical protein
MMMRPVLQRIQEEVGRHLVPAEVELKSLQNLKMLLIIEAKIACQLVTTSQDAVVVQKVVVAEEEDG